MWRLEKSHINVFQLSYRTKNICRSNCIYNIHTGELFLQLLLLKVCESFRFRQIKKLEVYYGLQEFYFTFTEKKRLNKYCLCEVNLVSYMQVFSLMGQDVNLTGKIAALVVFSTFFSDGRINIFWYDFSASLAMFSIWQRNWPPGYQSTEF